MLSPFAFMHAKHYEILLLNNFAIICKFLSGVYTPWKPCVMCRCCQLDSELYFSNEIQLKFLERKNGEDNI